MRNETNQRYGDADRKKEERVTGKTTTTGAIFFFPFFSLPFFFLSFLFHVSCISGILFFLVTTFIVISSSRNTTRTLEKTFLVVATLLFVLGGSAQIWCGT